MDSYNKVNQPKQDIIVHNKAFVDQCALYEKQYEFHLSNATKND